MTATHTAGFVASLFVAISMLIGIYGSDEELEQGAAIALWTSLTLSIFGTVYFAARMSGLNP